jgi:predicted secreted hydrolase
LGTIAYPDKKVRCEQLVNYYRRVISLPKDAANHLSSNVEWWYCYAFLSGNGGIRYALVASFFQVGELAVPKGHYMIYSFIRLDERKYESRSFLDRMLAYQMAGFYLPLYLILKPTDWSTWKQYKKLLQGNLPSPHLLMDHAFIQSHPTRLKYGSCELSFPNDRKPNFQLQINDKSTRILLNFNPAKPASIIDEQGTLNGLRYFSVTRNQVFGELHTNGMTETLSGEGWFDHQWGRNYGLLQGGGWDWFGLQLEDGRDLLINRLHPADSASPDFPIAKLISKDSVITTTENVLLKPLKYWKSIHTGVKYPVEWQISLPHFSIDLHITPLLNHQEIPIIGPLKAIWEGACTLTGEGQSPQGIRTPIKGKGFIELVGYAD